VEQALHRAPALALANILVRSQDGFVTLSGVANTREDIATAGLVAARVRGVTGVRNEIRVAHRPWRG
jgi:osmotically-inducible protein OsmY